MPRDAKSAYSEKLRDPRWQRMRLDVLERDEWACQICGAKDKTLNVHHMMYEWGRDPWEYDPEVLQTLCEDCHETEFRTKDTAVKKLLMALAVRSAHADTINELAEWVSKVGIKSSDGEEYDVGFQEVVYALSFHASSPLFIETLVDTVYDWGPWHEKSRIEVVYRTEASPHSEENRVENQGA